MFRWLNRPNIEWLVDLWVRIRGNRLARYAGLLILAALAALSNAVQILIAGGFAIWGQKIEIADTPGWVAVFLVGAAIVLLIFDRLVPPANQTPNANDVRLYEAFQQMFPDHMKIFLKEHSFGNDWRSDQTSSLFGFEYEWRGARFQFQDRRLDGALAAVKHKCRLLVSKLSEYSGLARGGVPRMTVKTEMDRMHGMSQETLAHIDELNTIATELYDAIDKLDDMARDKLAVASSTLREKTGQ